MTKSAVVGAAVVACALLVGGAYVKYGTEGEVQVEQPVQSGNNAEPAADADRVAFARWGNIVNVEETTAGLVYEEQGKPALRVDLVFTMATICGIDGREATCPLFTGAPLFAQGARVYVEGVREGQIVTVTKITEQVSE